jgi:membrane protease YdiL (CAAX protease family)
VGSLVVPQLVLGLFAGVLYAWTGSLAPGIVAHAAHNGLVLVWSALATGGSR